MSIEKGSRWQHKRRGTTYEVVAIGGMQADGNELDDAKVVIYRSEATGYHWVRPLNEFIDGRFVELGHR